MSSRLDVVTFGESMVLEMHDGRGKNHQAYLWQYSHPAGPVVFDFRLGREREGPKRFLGNFEGLLQSDGYGAYDHIGGPKLVHAACWAHARRHRPRNYPSGLPWVVPLTRNSLVWRPVIRPVRNLAGGTM